jgi:hypothetical protein
VKSVKEEVFRGWGLGRDPDMVEFRGSGETGERGGRIRFDRWKAAPKRGGEARRKLDEVSDRVFELDRFLEAARALTGVRKDVVDRIRAEIEAGTYETPGKIERLADRLMEALGEEPDGE